MGIPFNTGLDCYQASLQLTEKQHQKKKETAVEKEPSEEPSADNPEDGHTNRRHRTKAGTDKQRVNVDEKNIPGSTQPNAPGISVPDFLKEPSQGGRT